MGLYQHGMRLITDQGGSTVEVIWERYGQPDVLLTIRHKDALIACAKMEELLGWDLELDPESIRTYKGDGWASGYPTKE